MKGLSDPQEGIKGSLKFSTQDTQTCKHTHSALRATHSLMESHATYLLFTHHWIFFRSRGSQQVCVRARPHFHIMLSILLQVYYIVCATTEKSCVCSSASKVYLLSCLQRYISMCMNACVIVRACSGSFFCVHGCSPLPPACLDLLSHGLCSGTHEAAAVQRTIIASLILTMFLASPARERHFISGRFGTDSLSR